MNKHVERAKQLRDTAPQSNNCAQTIMRAYAEEMGLTEEQAAEILRELKERDDIKRAIITDERDTMIVETIDGEYFNVMYAAVNICSRIAGCELSFMHFDTEGLAS